MRKPAKQSASKTKTPAPRTPATRPAASGQSIRVRMYRVGFGDCFLVSLPEDGGSMSHMLIDFGVHSRGDIGTIPQIMADVAQECDGHLRLIVATHAHQDHISGFAKCAAQIKQIKVNEVWLPWTEDPSDSDASKLKQQHIALAEALRMHLEATGGSDKAMYAVLNAAGNPEALALLKSGVNGGTVRYLDGGKSLNDAAGIKGLAVRVLGPPRDQKFLARIEPPAGDRFLRLRNGSTVAINGVLPFEAKWAVSERELQRLSAQAATDKPALKKLIDTAAGLAFALDQAINNTSLVTLFTYRGKNLLFPGDAQYGNWQSWTETTEGRALLGTIDFLKVAHHGSENATPKSALEHMHAGIAAMISTQSTPWPSIPYAKMLTALESKASGMVRSNSIKVAGAKAAPSGPPFKPAPGFAIGPFWCDYTIPISPGA